MVIHHPNRDDVLPNGGALTKPGSTLSTSLRKRSNDGVGWPTSTTSVDPRPLDAGTIPESGGATEDIGSLRSTRRPPAHGTQGGDPLPASAQQYRGPSATREAIGATPTRSSSSGGGGGAAGLVAESNSSASSTHMGTSAIGHNLPTPSSAAGGGGGVGGGIRGLAGSVGGVATAAAGFGGGLFAGASSILSKAAAHVAGADVDPLSSSSLLPASDHAASSSASDIVVSRLRSQV